MVVKPRSGTRPPSRRSSLVAKLHILQKQHGLADEDYRDLLERETGRRSSKELDERELHAVIARLTGDPTPSSTLSGPYAAKLRALWLSGVHLGIVRNSSDAALTAFVKRQTGLDAVRWLRSAHGAARAIEALKAWLARDAGVRWTDHPDNPRTAIVEAQWRKLGRTDETLAQRAGSLAASELDALIRSLGREIANASRSTCSHLPAGG